ncbi:MAG: hemerythrin domain-containing protein [Myxococcota bacterium]|nr:hemerythrin domain-containing protein [Myxococcota bacterium]
MTGKVKGVRQALTGGAGIFERLATEHGEISTMIRRVAATTDDSDVRKELYPRIRSELLAHAKAEEKEVYSRFRTLPSLADKMGDAADEHHRIESLFDQLDAMSITDDQWISTFREMMTLVQKHVMEEELQVFPKAKKELSKEQSEELEGRYLDAKEDALTSLG